MSNSCAFLVLVLLVSWGSCAPNPSVFLRNGLQREQESVLAREPFEPHSPFQLPSQQPNVPLGGSNAIVVPPTEDLDVTYTKSDAYPNEVSRSLHNQFETLNKDALVGLLIENHIPFYVQTVVDPPKPIQTKIHVMRIPKKFESTTPLPQIDLNLVELIVNSSEVTGQEQFKIDNEKQIQTLINANQKIQNESDSILAITARRPEDYTSEEKNRGTKDLVHTKLSKSNENEDFQNDEPNTTTIVYEHQIIYTPERRNDSKSIWEHIGSAFDKAKEKTSVFVDKAKDKTGELFEKAKEKAKDAFDSDESKKDKVPVSASDDI